MTSLNHSFQNYKLFSESVESLSRNCDPNLTQNEHIYTICCGPEVADDVISGGSVKTTEGYVVLNFEAGSISSFWENQYQQFA